MTDATATPKRKLSKAGESLYATLGVEKGSSADDIKRAYRRMALKYHPDKNQNSPESTAKFQEINYANTVLSDETKKSIYDEYGSVGLSIAEQVGDENVKSYMRLKSPWCKALLVVGCLLTGCCCCFCCCFCCCWCCGKCKSDDDVDVESYLPPDDDLYDNDAFDNETQPQIIFNISGATVHDNVIVMQQPTSHDVASVHMVTTDSTTPRDANSQEIPLENLH